MKNNVVIMGADRALSAAVWARNNIEHWNIDLLSGLAEIPEYAFSFNTEHDATLFALKWS